MERLNLMRSPIQATEADILILYGEGRKIESFVYSESEVKSAEGGDRGSDDRKKIKGTKTIGYAE